MDSLAFPLIHSFIMERHSVHLIMIMTHPGTTVHYKLTMLKVMEDGGTTTAGILISISTTILPSMDSSTFLVLGP